MAIREQSDMHKRRLSRNIGVGLSLVAFCVIVFGMTVVKIREGSKMEAFDHQPRVSMTPAQEGQSGGTQQ